MGRLIPRDYGVVPKKGEGYKYEKKDARVSITRLRVVIPYTVVGDGASALSNNAC